MYSPRSLGSYAIFTFLFFGSIIFRRISSTQSVYLPCAWRLFFISISAANKIDCSLSVIYICIFFSNISMSSLFFFSLSIYLLFFNYAIGIGNTIMFYIKNLPKTFLSIAFREFETYFLNRTFCIP